LVREIPELQALIPQNETLTKTIESYRIHVITPLVGGSAEPGVNGESLLVRPSSVRGHLRFWWRATRGSQIETTEELYRRESEIFGNTETPSRVKIWVTSECPTSSTPIVIGKMNDKKNKMEWGFTEDILPYVFFPFSKSAAKKVIRCQRNYHFDLHVEYKESASSDSGEISLEDLKEEIDLALCAWINFGGIGARTRRGCGALSCKNFTVDASTPKEFQEWFQEKFVRKYELQLHTNDGKREWPTLSNRFLIGKKSNDIFSAWNGVVNAYHKFRRRASHKMGRSKWPEADSIKRITGMSSTLHREPYPPKTKPSDFIAFPRAQLGLPIIFQFREHGKLPSARDDNREPYQTMLIPAGKDRLTSPLIIKPLAIKGSSQSWGAIFVLNQPRLQSLQLKLNSDLKDNHYKEVEERVAQHFPVNEQAIYPNLQYAENPLGASHDAIEAFFNSKEVNEWLHNRNRG